MCSDLEHFPRSDSNVNKCVMLSAAEKRFAQEMYNELQKVKEDFVLFCPHNEAYSNQSVFLQRTEGDETQRRAKR